MEPVAFQRDSSLRASGYHTLTWAVAGLVGALPFHAAAVGRAWPVTALAVYLASLACVASLAVPINARRAAKLVVHPSYPADEPPGDGRRWVGVLLCFVGLSSVAATVASDRLAYLPAIGLAWLGGRALAWGLFSVREYLVLGAIASVGAAFCAVLAWAGGTPWPSAVSVYVWDVVLLGAAVPVAVRVNRRYLWYSRSPAG